MIPRSLLFYVGVCSVVAILGAVGYRTTLTRDGFPMETPDNEKLTPDVAAELKAVIEAGNAIKVSPAVGQVAGTVVEFLLRNETAKDIYIQLAGIERQGYWVLTRGGQKLQAEHNCAVCLCGVPCSVCGRQVASVKRIPAGSSHGWTWAGQEWSSIRNQSGECERGSPVGAGSLTVIVAYGFSSTVDSRLGANDTFVDDASPISTTFTYPGTQHVELIVR